MYKKASKIQNNNYQEVTSSRRDLEDATDEHKIPNKKTMRNNSFQLSFKKNNKEQLLSYDNYEGGDKAGKDDSDDRRSINMTQDGIRDKNFPINSIRTAKYSLLTFFPMNLYTQFSKAANLYFLLIAYMQTIKSISISGGKSVMALPLSVIVIISMVKDAYEDYQRHASDAQENNK